MKCLIIEDEYNAFNYLQSMLQRVVPQVEIMGHEDSVEGAVNWLAKNSHPDVVFMDIQLSDGKSFEIFQHVQVNAPIIFTTAYDQYAVNAFKYNSVDYLLKPIHQDDLAAAIEKFERQQFSFDQGMADRLKSLMEPARKKNRCLVKKARHYEYIDVKDIAFVHSEDGITFLYTFDKARHAYSKPVEKLMEVLDEEQFYQISRAQIINVDAIAKVHPHLNQRMKVEPLAGLAGVDLVVTRLKAKGFREWLDR
ncbi:MAG: LytTR family DNA-binding domain-containing protein [Bacteroidota bacterium]